MAQSDKSQVIKGAFWKFAERIAAQLVSLVVSIILARLLSPSEYGTISLVMVFITIANVFVSSGFGQALIQKKDADSLDFSSVFYFSLFFMISRIKAICLKNGGRKNEVYYTLQSGRLFP